ncbi:MAG: hypothetical protein JSS47_24600, partial [Proteobacteria bacterium]|nr:hypothetical protein [Pseudomonadota bacterium]
ARTRCDAAAAGREPCLWQSALPRAAGSARAGPRRARHAAGDDAATALAHLAAHLQRIDRRADRRHPAHQLRQSLMAIEAARQGQGLVMTSPHLVEAELAEGSLVQPFAQVLPLAQGYYLVHHAKLPLRPAAETVKQWLIDEAGGAGRTPFNRLS